MRNNETKYFKFSHLDEFDIKLDIENVFNVETYSIYQNIKMKNQGTLLIILYLPSIKL